MSIRNILLTSCAILLWLPLVIVSFAVHTVDGDEQASYVRSEIAAKYKLMRMCDFAGLSMAGSEDDIILDAAKLKIDQQDLRCAEEAAALCIRAGALKNARQIIASIDPKKRSFLLNLMQKQLDGQKLTAEERAEASKSLRTFPTAMYRRAAAEALGFEPVSDAAGITQADIAEYRRCGGRDAALAAAAAFIIAAALFMGIKMAVCAFMHNRAGRRDPELAAKMENDRRFFIIHASQERYSWHWLKALYFFSSISWLTVIVSAAASAILGKSGWNYIHIVIAGETAAYAAALAVLAALFTFMCRRSEEYAASESTPGGSSQPQNDPEAAAACGTVPSRSELKDALCLSGFKPNCLLYGFAGYGLTLIVTMTIGIITGALGLEGQSSNPMLYMLAQSSLPEFIGLLIMVDILGPVYEEIIFRGVLFSGLKTAPPAWGAAILASLIFSLCHGDAYGIPALTALGAILCMLRQKSGSLWPSVICHMMWNGMITAMLFFVLVLN